MGVVRRTAGLACVTLLFAVPGVAAAWDLDAGQLESAVSSAERSQAASAAAAAEDPVRTFYAARAFAPAWLVGGGDSTEVSRRADELIVALRRSADDGLDPSAYAPERLARSVEDARAGALSRDPQRQAALEVSLTRAFLALAHDLHDGRVNPRSVSWSIAPDPFDASRALALAVDRGSIDAGLALARPPAPEYAQLRGALADLRTLQAAGGWPTVSAGATLAEGVEDDRVLELRARLRATGELMPAAPGATLEGERRYDDEVKRAVEEFQRRHGLDADGKVAKATLTTLNVPVEARIAQVELAMERWRWMPHDRGERFVQVNVPAFELDAYEAHGAKKVLHSAVVAGQADPKWHTPVLADVIDGVDVNPAWNVPAKIMREDVIPNLQKSPGFPSKIGLKIIDKATGEEVDPTKVEWSPELAGQYTMRQVAGPQNPLGGTRVVMHNRKGVYLHGTPSTWAFSVPSRALSHGCVRVEKIVELTKWMMADADLAAEYDGAMGSRTSQRLEFEPAVPVYLGYFTAFVDEGGMLQFRPDLYGLDAQLKRALKSATSAAPRAEWSMRR